MRNGPGHSNGQQDGVPSLRYYRIYTRCSTPYLLLSADTTEYSESLSEGIMDSIRDSQYAVRYSHPTEHDKRQGVEKNGQTLSPHAGSVNEYGRRTWE